MSLVHQGEVYLKDTDGVYRKAAAFARPERFTAGTWRPAHAWASGGGEDMYGNKAQHALDSGSNMRRRAPPAREHYTIMRQSDAICLPRPNCRPAWHDQWGEPQLRKTERSLAMRPVSVVSAPNWP